MRKNHLLQRGEPVGAYCMRAIPQRELRQPHRRRPDGAEVVAWRDAPIRLPHPFPHRQQQGGTKRGPAHVAAYLPLRVDLDHRELTGNCAGPGGQLPGEPRPPDEGLRGLGVGVGVGLRCGSRQETARE